jgi:hypothetical protein
MKKLFLLAGAILVPFLVMGQNPAVDQLFDKYQGKEGFTTVYINKDIFKMISDNKEAEHDLNQVLDKISGIKILAQEDEEVTGNLNFYEELKKNMDFSKYEELVVVREKDQDVRIVARENNDRIAELLIIVGGEDNVLVWIEGNFTFEDLSELSDIDGLDKLDLIGNHN